jgi:hypothetical protein
VEPSRRFESLDDGGRMGRDEALWEDGMTGLDRIDESSDPDASSSEAESPEVLLSDVSLPCERARCGRRDPSND